MATYQIIGEWTGPVSPAGDFNRLQHIEYANDRIKRDALYIERVRALGRILFTDGTALIVSVRNVTNTPPSRREPQKLGYRTLINKCIEHGVNRVADLPTEI